MKPLKALFVCLLAVAMFFGLSSKAVAIPELQIYIEGATYDSDTEKWVVDASAGDTITLWVIGNVNGPGGKGNISNVQLVAAYEEGDSAPTVEPTEFTTPQTYDGLTDNQQAGNVSPILGTGDVPEGLSSHGVYGEGTAWTYWELGTFDQTGDTIADFNGDSPLPTPVGEGGQINAYNVTIEGEGLVYFDVFGEIEKPGGRNGPRTQTVFAPYSHVANTNVPEPATALLLGAGIIGIVALGRKKLFK
jgi:hypothetical protein